MPLYIGAPDMAFPPPRIYAAQKQNLTSAQWIHTTGLAIPWRDARSLSWLAYQLVYFIKGL